MMSTMSRRISSTDRASSPRYCVAVYPPGRYPLPSSHGPDSSPESRTANTAEATHPRPRPASLATAAAGRAETERKKANDGSSRAAYIVPSVNVMVIWRAPYRAASFLALLSWVTDGGSVIRDPSYRHGACAGLDTGPPGRLSMDFPRQARPLVHVR